MKPRYLPTIVDINGKEYTNVTWPTLGEAMDALEDFIVTFASYNDTKIKESYVLNIQTGKIIYR